MYYINIFLEKYYYICFLFIIIIGIIYFENLKIYKNVIYEIFYIICILKNITKNDKK